MDPGRSDYQYDWRMASQPHIQQTGYQLQDNTPQDMRTLLPFPSERMYKCGGCTSMYHMIWQLHEHVLLHTTEGSYSYNNMMRTAFPKPDSVSVSTQTVDSDSVCGKVEVVCSSTQTEESLASYFTARGDVEHTKYDDVKVDVEVKVENEDVDNSRVESETADNDMDGGRDTVNSDNDPYAGDTDEDVSFLSVEDSSGDVTVEDPEWTQENVIKTKKLKSSRTSKSKPKTNTTSEKFVRKIPKEGKSVRKKLNEEKSVPKKLKQEKSEIKKQKVEKSERKKHKIKSKHKSNMKSKDRNTAVEKPPIQCKFCDKLFPNNLQMRRHCIEDHPEEKNFQCRHCDAAFVTDAELQKHRREHNKEKNRCHICDKILSSPQNLQDHITTHTGEKMFECKDCGNFFRSRSQLSLHASRRHNPNFDHMCENCGRVFKCRQNLQCHIKCCLDIRPFGCKICGKRYPRNTNLNVHMRKHTGDKPFVCHTCGMKFSHSNTLTKHMLVHTGERKFTCEICGQKFKAHNALKDHERIHNQEKRFTCQYCGKGFIKKCNMVTHIRQHTGETPYKCKICGQAYKQNVLLRTHMQSHKTDPIPLSDTSQTTDTYQPVDTTNTSNIAQTFTIPSNPMPQSYMINHQVPANQPMSHLPLQTSHPVRDQLMPQPTNVPNVPIHHSQTSPHQQYQGYNMQPMN